MKTMVTTNDASRLLNHVRSVKEPLSAQSYPTGSLRDFRARDRVIGIRHEGATVVFRFAADAGIVRPYFVEESVFEEKTDPV